MFELIPFDHIGRSVRTFDPFRDMEDFDRFFSNAGGTGSMIFRTDVADTGDAFRLECELPGFSKEDIELNVENDCLTISAQRKLDKDDSKGTYIKRERFYGSCSRSFDVSAVDVEKIDAGYVDGILTITMPKKVENIPASRKLEIR